MDQAISESPGRLLYPHSINLLLAPAEVDIVPEDQDTIRSQAQEDPPIYSPLNADDSGACRLLYLWADQDETAVPQCDLVEASLNDDIEFDALSYVWGDATNRRKILVNGHEVSVTANLEDALRHLRTKDETHEMKVLWVDALCINQKDNAEKNKQVAQMDVVYRKARKVLCWVGNSDSNSKRVWQHLRNVKIGPSDPRVFEEHIKEIFRSKTEDVDRLAEKEMVVQMGLIWFETTWEGWEAVALFLTRPWFERVWILQEAMLAKQAEMHCGYEWAGFGVLQQLNHSLHDWLTVLREWHQEYQQRIGSLAFAEMMKKTSHDNPEELTVVRTVNRCREFAVLLNRMKNLRPILDHLTLLRNELVRPNLGFARLELEKQPYYVLRIIGRHHTRQATDKRDLVFALRSLVHESNPSRVCFEADYGLSLSSCYTRFTRSFIQSTRNLDILSIACEPTLGLDDRAENHRMPSWVRDWRTTPPALFSPLLSPFGCKEWTMHMLQNEYENYIIYDASMCGSRIEFIHDGKVMVCRGIQVGTIEKMGDYNRWDASAGDDIPQSFDDFDRIFNGWKNVANLRSTQNYPHTGQSREEAFYRTLLGDERPLIREVLDAAKARIRLGPSLNGTFSNLQFPPTTMEQKFNFLGLLFIAPRGGLPGPSAHRRFFVTDKGHFGLCPHDAREGDKILVLLGGRVPFVVRKFEPYSYLIGESYVHGIMDGEMMQLVDSGKAEEEEYLIA